VVGGGKGLSDGKGGCSLSVLLDTEGVRSNFGCCIDEVRGGGWIGSGAWDVLSLAVRENVRLENAYWLACWTWIKEMMRHTVPIPSSVLLEVSDPLALPLLAGIGIGGFRSIILTTSPCPSPSTVPAFDLFFFLVFLTVGSTRPSISNTSSSGTLELSLLALGVTGPNSNSS